MYPSEIKAEMGIQLGIKSDDDITSALETSSLVLQAIAKYYQLQGKQTAMTVQYLLHNSKALDELVKEFGRSDSDEEVEDDESAPDNEESSDDSDDE